MELRPVARRFILHWGEMGSKWGINRTVSQIHALLYLAGRPLHAEEISETLGVARSNVSTSLKELQSWQLIHVVHLMSDRRDHFETSTNVWELFRTVVRERKRREFDPLYHHELRAALPQQPSAALELRIHAGRSLVYGLLFAGLAWLVWGGVWLLLLTAMLLTEVVLTLWDFLVEDRSRILPPAE